MKTQVLSYFVTIALLYANMVQATEAAFMPSTDKTDNTTVNSWLNQNTGFEKNFGQVSDFEGKPVREVLFRANLGDYSVFITEQGVSYVMYQRSHELDRSMQELERLPFEPDRQPEKALPANLQYARIDLLLKNSVIQDAHIEYEEPLPGYTNYYLSSCPDGALFVKTYNKIRINEVYPGINWVWKFDGGQLHHEFEIEPGADLSNIKMEVKWADCELTENGKKIIFSTPLGKIADGAILAYENTANKKPVYVSYKKENNLIVYDVKNYSGQKPLIIDPPLSLTWATYYRGVDNDNGKSITTDASGNVFVTGRTYSENFPTKDPEGGTYFQGTHGGVDGYWKNNDVFILKFNNAGVRLWATYYGGEDGDFGNSIITDFSGNVFITGDTYSEDFPIFDPGGEAYFKGAYGTGDWNSDVFILKFNNAGVRLWATYYGGEDGDYGSSMITDVSGNVFVTGRTDSENFSTYDPGGGAYFQGTHGGIGEYLDSHVFILKFNNAGVRLWATYYGGNETDYGNSITTDSWGNVFVSGTTYSENFSTYDAGDGAYLQETHGGGLHDAFILKFNNAGVRQWATYYGGNGGDYGNSITTDVSGNVFLAGVTYSENFPTYDPDGEAYFQDTVGAGYSDRDAYILKFNNEGVQLWATYYGGSEDDYGYSITTDSWGNVFLTGYTYSYDFPNYDPGGGAYFQGTHAGWGHLDVIVLKFNNAGERLWATYYGGSVHDYGNCITADVSGNVFVTGTTDSEDIPIENPGEETYFQSSGWGLDSEVFILKFGDSTVTVDFSE
ncbi:MAG: SBBP repeat-containing protein, partial [Chitinophagales bacterium]